MSLITLGSLIIFSLSNQNYKTFLKIMLLFSIISLFIIYESMFDRSMVVYIWNYNIKLDYITVIFKLIIMLFMLNYTYIIRKFFDYEKVFIKEYILVVWIAIIGSYFILMSNEFFILYLALELQNLILYMLTSSRRWRSYSIEAGIKYYIMGSFSSGILLYGIILLFGVFGTLDFVEIGYLMLDMLYFNMDTVYIIYILSFILVGLLFKLGIAPFHWWVPEVYEGAPLVVTLFFIVVPKISLVFLLVKLYNYIFINFIEIFSDFFLICTIFSLALGFFFTLYQKKIVKFLAYSTIFNGGFFMACFSNGTYLSLVSLLYFFIPYILLLLGVFFFLICFRRINNIKINLLWDLALVGNSHMLLGLVFSILILSLAGIPPLSGFFGKFFIFLSLILNKFYFLFLLLFIFSIASSFYYFRIVRFMFFSTNMEYIFLKSYLNTFLISIYFLCSLFFFLFFDFVFLFIFNIISTLPLI